MTVKENTSPANQLQIIFWDLVINIMSMIQQFRSRIPRKTVKKNPWKQSLRNTIIILICVGLGLYLGILLGYLGI